MNKHPRMFVDDGGMTLREGMVVGVMFISGPQCMPWEPERAGAAADAFVIESVNWKTGELVIRRRQLKKL